MEGSILSVILGFSLAGLFALGEIPTWGWVVVVAVAYVATDVVMHHQGKNAKAGHLRDRLGEAAFNLLVFALFVMLATVLFSWLVPTVRVALDTWI